MNGAIHINDALANQAHADALTAYTKLAGETATANLTGMDLGGLTLTTGVYRFSSSAQLTGTLTLNTAGNANAPFHFLIGSTLTTASNSAVVLLGGPDNNIFWQVGSSATIGTGTRFVGTIIASSSVTLTSGASLEGRALAINGAVTLDTNNIQAPAVSTPTMRLIAPEELASIYEIKFALDTMQGTNLMQRMDDIRAGSTGFCATGYVPQETNQGYSKDSDGKVVLPDRNPAPAFLQAPENRWGFFVTGSGAYVKIGDDDRNAAGYSLTNGAVMLGADYRLLRNLSVGIYGGYETGTAALFQDGRLTMQGGNVGAFATYFSNGFYADVAGGGGWNSYDIRRAALSGDARGSTDGTEVNALGAIGYDWRFGCLHLGPVASVQYTDVHIDQYTERSSLFPLQVQGQGEDSLRTTAGLRASYDIKIGQVILRPEVRAGWLHEYDDQAYPIDARLASGGGGILTVFGPTIGRDAAQIRAGVGAQLTKALAIYAYYDGIAGRTNYNSNGGSCGFSFNF